MAKASLKSELSSDYVKVTPEAVMEALSAMTPAEKEAIGTQLLKKAPKVTKVKTGERTAPSVTYGEYMDKPTMSIVYGGRFPLTFGLVKAKAILYCLKSIQAFVAKYDTQADD